MSLKKKLEEYEDKYGHLPNTQDELVDYILATRKIDSDKLNMELSRIRSIRWKELDYTIYIVPHGTPRPRNTRFGNHFYVKGASETKELFTKLLEVDSMIYTRVESILKAYFPTPTSSMTNIEILLAELGHIRHISKPDYDNAGKSCADALEGVLLINDSLINPGHVDKFYSLKPRLELKIRYQTDFDSKFNMKKILNSKSFDINKDKIEYYT